MREAVVKEAKLYTGDGECYLHVEKAGEGSPYAVVIAGDPVAMLQGVFNVLSRMENVTGIPMKEQLRMLEKARRRVGTHQPFRTFESGEDEAV